MFKNHLAVQVLRSHRGYDWPAVIQFQQVYTRQNNCHASVNAAIYIAGFNTNRLIGNFNVISASETAYAITRGSWRGWNRFRRGSSALRQWPFLSARIISIEVLPEKIREDEGAIQREK